MSGADVLRDFQKRADDYVTNCLSGYAPERHAKEKSIRDAIWGTFPLHAWEVAILDSPLLQRLRDIRQTGVAYLVYPTAVHTRFDHTLGVVTVASRIVQSINDKHPTLHGGKVSYPQHMCVRLSALLHDVGHSCLSHVSETVFGESEEFNALLIHVNELFGVKPKPHEIMSWLVVRSDPFRKFMDQLREKGVFSNWEFAPEHVDHIAGNIIGYRENPKEKFLADIINGPMDADKLDYLVRDAYFAGPTVVYDLERFLHTVDAIEYPRDNTLPGEGPTVTRLAIPIKGVTALEQIIISKLMLFSYLYHHQKIRCAEGMYHEALKRWEDVSRKNPAARKVPALHHPTLFLAMSDRSLFPKTWPPDIDGDKVAGEIISMLTRRDLYKRALVISRLFVPDIDTNEPARIGFERLLRCGRSAKECDNLRKAIFDSARKMMASKRYAEEAKELRKQFRLHHLLLDVPSSPTVEETEGVMIPVSHRAGRDDQEFVPLRDIFPIAKWVDAYNAIKWRGHVFTLEAAAPFVNAAAVKIFEAEPYHLRFTNEATDLCKIPRPPTSGHSLPGDW